MIIFEENFKWHLEAFASELFIHILFRFVLGLPLIWLWSTLGVQYTWKRFI